MEDSYVVTHYMAGQQNRPSPFANAPSPDSMSHNWRGPGFYSVPDTRFILLKETTVDPSVQRSASASASASYARKPSNVSTSTLPAYADDPWTRRWRGPGAGFYSPLNHTWSRDTPGQNFAADSRLFFNEEDWLKYKSMCANPIMNGSRPQTCVSGGETNAGGRSSPRKPKHWERNILSDYF